MYALAEREVWQAVWNETDSEILERAGSIARTRLIAMRRQVIQRIERGDPTVPAVLRQAALRGQEGRLGGHEVDIRTSHPVRPGTKESR